MALSQTNFHLLLLFQHCNISLLSIFFLYLLLVLKRKRSCFINAGMTNNCDFKDLISATSARRIWQSPNLSPGKRSGPLPVKSILGDLENLNELKMQDYDL